MHRADGTEERKAGIIVVPSPFSCFGVNQELAVSVRSSLLVQHHTQERSIDLETAVVLDET
jgi:hypothetical protein